MGRRLIASCGVAIGLLAIGASSASNADAQSVEITADTREIYAGLPFSLLVQATGFDEDPEPTAPDLAIDGCTVVYAGSSPRVVQSTSIVNGRRSQRVDVTFVYQYQVTPAKAGAYKVPRLTVRQGKKDAQSSTVTFRAKSVKKTDKMVLRVEVPDRPVWIGETFELTVNWYLGADPSRPSFGIPLFERNDLASVKPVEAAARRRQTVTFSAGTSTLELPYDQKRTTLDGQPFTRLQFKTLVTPLVAGTFELPAARVVAGLEVGVGRDRFGFPVSKSEVFEAVDKPRTLVVKSLPMSGRPAAFRNAVGTGFTIDVLASRTVVRVGDPIELTITVKSDSRLTGMALPNLAVLLDANHFAVGDEEPVGALSDDARTKVFKVTAQLKSADAREVPPLELAFFNPKKGAYETARSQPIALQVAGSATVGASQVTRPSGDGPAAADVTNVSLVGADLALSARGRALDQPLRVSSLTPLLAALYIVPCLLLGFMVWRRRTAGARAASGAERKRVSAFDQAIAAAATEPAKEGAKKLASTLRAMKKQRGETPPGFDRLIADLDSEVYNPVGSSQPLKEAIVARCKDIGGSLLGAAVLVLALLAGAGDAHADAIEDGRNAYQQGVAMGEAEDGRVHFVRAMQLFRAAASEHQDRPELLVDWGNAALGARDLGWAVLAYRRALRLDRGNDRARSNLAWVRGTLPSWAPKPSNSGALASLFFWHSDWSLARRHLVGAFAFAIGILLLVPWRPRRHVAAVVVAGFSLAVALAMLVSVMLEPDRNREAVVVRDAESLRSADSPGAAPVIARPLPAGLEVTVVDARERWSQVELADGQRGWLPESAIEYVSR